MQRASMLALGTSQYRTSLHQIICSHADVTHPIVVLRLIRQLLQLLYSLHLEITSWLRLHLPKVEILGKGHKAATRLARR